MKLTKELSNITKNLCNIKKRYISALVTVIISIAVTPWCFKEAYEFRGYEAMGGEYFVIPLGIVIAVTIIEAANEIDRLKGRLKKKGTNRYCKVAMKTKQAN